MRWAEGFIIILIGGQKSLRECEQINIVKLVDGSNRILIIDVSQ